MGWAGRNIVYRISYALFFIFTFPVAFAPNAGKCVCPRNGQLTCDRTAAVFLIFRLITGFCGSAFLSVAGGSVSDMFPNSTIAK
jgi:MFS family permease